MIHRQRPCARRAPRYDVALAPKVVGTTSHASQASHVRMVNGALFRSRAGRRLPSTSVGRDGKAYNVRLLACAREDVCCIVKVAGARCEGTVALGCSREPIVVDMAWGVRSRARLVRVGTRARGVIGAVWVTGCAHRTRTSLDVD